MSTSTVVRRSGTEEQRTVLLQVVGIRRRGKETQAGPMESPPIEGVNTLSVVPSGEASNTVPGDGTGGLVSGDLGEIGMPGLVPRANYNALFAGKTIKLTINASTDSVRFNLPVTLRDTVAARVQNTLVELPLFFHGSPQTAGIKEGTATIEDVFGLGGADIAFTYRFEQLSDSFRVQEPEIRTNHGADVPVIISDSFRVTGVREISPETGTERTVTVEFTEGGWDNSISHRTGYSAT